VNLRDPARPDSFSPVVRRLLTGEFDEGPGYETYRRRGTTDWLLIHTLAGCGRFGSNGLADVRAGSGTITLPTASAVRVSAIRRSTTHSITGASGSDDRSARAAGLIPCSSHSLSAE